MAKANVILIEALRKTIKSLTLTKEYQWGHMGSCNCGFLAQELTKLSKKEIHDRAMQKYGDWNEQLNDYCPTSGLLMDDLISEMLSAGLDTQDLKHLEKLSDKRVLKYTSSQQRYLHHNNKTDVILYLKVWAELLEDDFSKQVSLPRAIETATSEQ